jgi:probable phosphoglycerate mutase
MRTAFDGSIRRRIHFFRHGDVSYVDKEGNRVPDSRAVPLTDWGREQAALMCDYVKELSFDKAVCSGLPRTVETAEGILKGRGLKVEVMSEFEEIRSDPDRYKNLKSLHDVAYAFEGAHLPGARYGEGESFLEFEARIVTGMMHLVADKSWQNLALIAHGGVNRAILGWASGASLGAFHAFDQNTCCLNIVDVDTHPDTGEIRRMTVRGMNITPYDPVKKNVDKLALEMIAERMRAKYG